MRLVDKLRQAKAAALDKMDALNDAANERGFNEDEQRAWDQLKAETATIDAQLASAEQRAATLRGDTTAQPVGGSGPRLVAEDGTILRALTPKERLVDTLPRRAANDEPISIARTLRGIVLGDWRGASPLERAIGIGGSGGVTVPESMAARWLDVARSKSVVMQAGAITIPMRTLSERIVRIETDPTVTFRKEHTPIPESDIVFAGIDLKAKLAGILCRVSIELLEDSPMAEAAIEQAMLGAMAAKIDWALLAGDGLQTGDLDNPLGLVNTPGVHDVPFVPGSFDSYLDAYAEVLNSNGVPNAWVENPSAMILGAKLKSGIVGDKSQLAMPEPLASLPKYVTTTLPNNGGTGTDELISVIGDFTMLGLGLRTGMVLEASRFAGDAFSKAEILIRLYCRLDVAVLRPAFFAKITGIKPAVVTP